MSLQPPLAVLEAFGDPRTPNGPTQWYQLDLSMRDLMEVAATVSQRSDGTRYFPETFLSRWVGGGATSSN